VRLRPGQQVTEDELKAYCSGKIAHFKVPRYIRFTGEFPMTVTGKIQKFKMREVSTEELGLQDAAGTTTA
jgi:fatty-acyl-CoA synthase